jgi:hypothetical protein
MSTIKLKSKTVSVTTGGVEVLPEVNGRSALTIQNNGAVACDLFLDEVGTAGAGARINLQPTQAYEPLRVPVNAIHAITASGTATLTVWYL